MQIVVICRRRVEAFSDEAFAALLDAEAEAVRVLYGRGVVRAAWTREDAPGACLLVEAPGVDEARDALASAPLFANGMVEAQYIPVRGYRGFGPRN
jgi:muconolactone delta-isomerase